MLGETVAPAAISPISHSCRLAGHMFSLHEESPHALRFLELKAIATEDVLLRRQE